MTSPGDDAALDINDLYVFEGEAADRTAIAVTVSPAAASDSWFARGSRQSYSIRIDQDGDAVEDVTYHFRFFGPFFGANGGMSNSLFRAYRYAVDSPEIGGRLAGPGH